MLFKIHVFVQNPNFSIKQSIFHVIIFLLCVSTVVNSIENENFLQNVTYKSRYNLIVDKKILPEQLKNNNNNQKNFNNFDNLQEYFDSVADNKRNNRTLQQNQNHNKYEHDHDHDHRGSTSTTRRPGGSRRSTKRHSSGTHRPPNGQHTPPQHTQNTFHTRTSSRFTTRFPRRTTTESTTMEAVVADSDPGPALDFTWIILCAFIIFTMQTGFGLLEGGFTYWIFGYGITYGTWKGSTSFFGFGYYAVDAPIETMGDLFTSFFFQMSFATTATTIVSGSMAERCNFKAYCLYSLFATITYSVSARWIWGPGGFLAELGAIDIAGSGAVHLVGGTAAFVAAWMLGPRLGRFDGDGEAPPPGNNLNVLLGLFNLWWAWFAFNAGSTYGVTADKWKFAARAAASTLVASIGGGMVGLLWGFLKPGKPFGTLDIVNSVLGALVGVTAGCAIFHTPEAFITGMIGALVALLASFIPDLMKIDDPVGATAVHGFGGLWGLLAVGFFADSDEGILGLTKGNAGLFRGGSGYLLGVQAIAACCIITWSLVSTFIILLLINLVCPLRVTPHEELVGLDFAEHGIRKRHIGTTPAISLFGSLPEMKEKIKDAGNTGQDNPVHLKITEALRDVRRTKLTKRHKRNSIDKRRFSADEVRIQSQKMKSAALFARGFRKLESKGNRINPRDRQYIFDEYMSPLKSSTETLYSADEEANKKNKSKVKTKDKEKKEKEKEEKPGQDNRIFHWVRNEKQKIEITREDSLENIKTQIKKNIKTDDERLDDKVEKIDDKNKGDYIP